MVSGNLAGTSTAASATQYPFQRKAFYAAGRYWVFYSNGTNFVYRTSADGITWSSATTIGYCPNGYNASVFFDGTYIHYAFFSIDEELADPEFNNAAEWTCGTGWSISSGSALKGAGSAPSSLIEANPFTVTVGTTYKVTLVIVLNPSNGVTVTLGGDTSETFTTTGTKTFYLDAVNTDSLAIVAGTPPLPYPLVLASISVKGSNLLYRRGTPNSDGTINWSAAQQTVLLGQFASTPMIAVDSGGYAWVGCVGASTSPIPPAYYSPFVYKNANNDGTWSTDTGFPYQLADPTVGTNWAISITPLTEGKVYVLFGRDYPQEIRGRLWDGSWGDEEELAWYSRDINRHSVVADGDDVHLVSLVSAGTNHIRHWKRTYGVGWGESVEVYGSEIGIDSGPVLSIDTATGDLYCFWSGYPEANKVYYKRRDNASGTWDTDPTEWLDETTDTFLTNDTLTCFYQAYDPRIGLLYTTKTASPFNVKFAILLIPLVLVGKFIGPHA